ncbi:unnamed protein product [Pedinophyceae sp. YPF-701]|nr:unnamed protein product [Pedinophyceae sp. YPF-701]
MRPSSISPPVTPPAHLRPDVRVNEERKNEINQLLAPVNDAEISELMEGAKSSVFGTDEGERSELSLQRSRRDAAPKAKPLHSTVSVTAAGEPLRPRSQGALRSKSGKSRKSGAEADGSGHGREPGAGPSNKRFVAWGQRQAETLSPMARQMAHHATVRRKVGDRRKLARYTAKQEEYQRINEAKELEGERLRMARTRRQEEAFNQRLRSVLDGMTGKMGLIKETQRVLEFTDKSLQTRREQLHQEWEEGVHSRVQSAVTKAVNERWRQRAEIDMPLWKTMDPVLLGKLAGTLSKEQLSSVLPKGIAPARRVSMGAMQKGRSMGGTSNAAFTKQEHLDGSLFTGELTKGLRVPVRLQDPTKKSIARAMRETSLKQALVNGIVSSRMDDVTAAALFAHIGVKDMLDTSWWDKVHATPYGYELPESDPANSRITRSRVKVDHFDVPTGEEGLALMRKEYDTGAMKRPVAVPTRMRDTTFFDVMQQRDAKFTHDQIRDRGHGGGDQWLESKGKRNITGTEATAGSLFPVIAPSHTPVAQNLAEKRAAERGQPPPVRPTQRRDLWCDRKGRRAVDGPEVKDLRRGLFPIIQPQRPGVRNPYDDRCSMGDSFLETIWHHGKRLTGEPPCVDPNDSVWAAFHSHEPGQAASSRRLTVRAMASLDPDNTNILVCGGGGVAFETAKLLKDMGAWVWMMQRTEERKPAIEKMFAVWVKGDAMDTAAVSKVFDQIEGPDVVISTIGGGVTTDQKADSDGNINVINEAKKRGVKKFILVTSIGVRESYGALSERAAEVLGPVLLEKAKAEEALEKSGMDWCIVRPGGLQSEMATGGGVLTESAEVCGAITRQDVAKLVCKATFSDKSVGKILAAVDTEKLMTPNVAFSPFEL